MKAQGVPRDSLPWKGPFQPYAAWVGFIGSTIITLVAGFPVFLKGNWNTSDFVASYIGIPLFIVPIFGWKLWHNTKVSSHIARSPSPEHPLTQSSSLSAPPPLTSGLDASKMGRSCHKRTHITHFGDALSTGLCNAFDSI